MRMLMCQKKEKKCEPVRAEFGYLIYNVGVNLSFLSIIFQPLSI